MSATLTTVGERERVHAATPAALVTAAGLVAVLVCALLALRSIRIGEAVLATGLLRLMGTGAERVGTAVVVDAGAGRAGFTIASGCSTALLAAPFLAVGAIAVLTGRVRPPRALASVGIAAVGVVLLNQLRFGIVGAAIHLFGFERGYGQSHVLIGTLVSTVGLVAGLTAFVWSLEKRPGRAGTGA